MTNGSSKMAGTVSNISIGRRGWGCRGECCKDPKKPAATFFNNATRMECKRCGSKPNTKCILFGDGNGVNGGNWKKDNGVAPVAKPSAPSRQTAAGKAAGDQRAADNKLKKENEA